MRRSPRISEHASPRNRDLLRFVARVASALWLAALTGSDLLAQNLAVETETHVDGSPYDGLAGPTCAYAAPGQSLFLDDASRAWASGWVLWGSSPSGAIVRFPAPGIDETEATTFGYSSFRAEGPDVGPPSLHAADGEGGAYLATQVAGPTGVRSWLFRVDAALETTWGFELPEAVQTLPVRALIAGAGGVYHLAAQSLGDFPHLSRALASGALDWSRDWSDGSTFSAIDVDASGRAIVAGAREERPVVERLGLDGATSWRREIELGAEVAGEAAVVRALPDGGSLVAGPRRCDGFGCGAWVARLAGDGAVASLATLELGDFMAGDPQSILAYDDGGAYVAGAVVGHASPNRWFLARLTPDGVVEWLRAEPSTEGRSRFGELQPRAGGGVYALRSDGSSAIDGNATLLAFSPTGASAGSLRLDPPEGRTEACGLSLDAAGRLRVLVATHSEGIVPDRKTDFWHLVVDPTVGVLATNKEPALARPGEILGAAAIGPGDDLWILGTAAKSIRLTSWELTRIARGGGVAWTRDVGAVEVAMVPPPGDLGVDGEGYAYVLTQDQTGQGPGTRLRQFDPRGDATWVVDLPPVAFVGSKPRIAGVGAGALLAAAEATGDGALLRIRRASRTGDLAEVAELGPYSFVAPYDLEIGRQGDFWVSGEAEGRCLVAGWRADGTSILHFELPSETGPTSGCLDLALSSDGAVLAAGYAGAFSEKSLALRVTPTGELDWLQLSAGFPVHVARWTAVDVDEKGHVTFGGSSRAGEETRLLWTHLDAQGDELWSKSELVRPGDGALQVSDRGDRVGILTVDGIHAADGRPRVRLRLFGRASGAVSSELVLPQGSGLSASGPTIPLATRAGRTIVTGTALRASADLWAVEVSGTGDLFFDDFETGNLDGWSDLAPRD